MNTIKKLVKYLNKEYDFEYNEVTNEFFYKRKESEKFIRIDDRVLNSLFVESKTKIKGLSLVDFTSALKSDVSVLKNPFKEYFNELPQWDGKTDYIRMLANTVKTNNKVYWNKYFKKWLVGVVASLLDDDVVNHLVLILIGKQGVGKTTWLNNLLPKELGKHIHIGKVRFDKDSQTHLSECMFINIDEFETFGNKDLNELKSLITKEKIRIRRPYGRIMENLPRRASFMASLNNDLFLVDLTGNRRFIVLKTKDIEYQHKVDLKMVYSQCKHLYENGYKFYLNSKEIERVSKVNERYRMFKLEEELLLQYFEPTPKFEGEILTATQILYRINERSKTFMKEGFKYTLGKALSKHNFVRGRTKNNGHGWWVRDKKKKPNKNDELRD